ncbi:hypothetical protein SEVIR_5G322100v4 [Setaria viridis]
MIINYPILGARTNTYRQLLYISHLAAGEIPLTCISSSHG